MADPETLELIRSRFVPIAIDQHVHRKLQTEEGKWFAKVLRQAGRDLKGRSQGVYLFAPDGNLLAFRNTAKAESVKKLMRTALNRFDEGTDFGEATTQTSRREYWHEPPRGGLVVAVTTKLLGGYEDATTARAKAYRESLGEDHLWIRADEANDLAAGHLPESLLRRIARYHLIDNTRGEPPMWRAHEVRQLEFRLQDGQISGSVHLENDNGDRGYKAQLLGFVTAKDGKVTQFDLVAKGNYWGHGRFTRFAAPSGEFPVAVAFRLIEAKSAADRVLPGAARGNPANYLK